MLRVAFVLMVICAVAGVALTFWALRDNLRRTRHAPYRPRRQDTRVFGDDGPDRLTTTILAG